jgi:hypothetical protein
MQHYKHKHSRFVFKKSPVWSFLRLPSSVSRTAQSTWRLTVCLFHDWMSSLFASGSGYGPGFTQANIEFHSGNGFICGKSVKAWCWRAASPLHGVCHLCNVLLQNFVRLSVQIANLTLSVQCQTHCCFMLQFCFYERNRWDVLGGIALISADGRGQEPELKDRLLTVTTCSTWRKRHAESPSELF